MGGEMNLDKAQELADAHWSYVENLLRAHNVYEEDIKIAKFNYISAFMHGWKHALEDSPDVYYQGVVKVGGTD